MGERGGYRGERKGGRRGEGMTKVATELAEIAAVQSMPGGLWSGLGAVLSDVLRRF